METDKTIEILKALANETRLNIVRWLKEPHKNFPPQGGCLGEPVDLKGGVCCTSIKQKIGNLAADRVHIPRHAAVRRAAPFREARQMDVLPPQ